MCLDDSVLARFWSKVNQAGDCWLWTGAIRSTGYGSFAIAHGDIVSAHRFSYTLAYGPIPPGLFVCHICDIRACVRPSHLFLGTARDNLADMTAKGRRSRSGGLRGEQFWNVTLSEGDVRSIRIACQVAKPNYAILARTYGVTRSNVRSIALRKTWKHVFP